MTSRKRRKNAGRREPYEPLWGSQSKTRIDVAGSPIARFLALSNAERQEIFNGRRKAK